MAAPRRITLEDWNRRNKNKSIEVIEILGKGAIKVLCHVCNSEFNSWSSHVGSGRKIICNNCNNIKFSEQARKAGMILLGPASPKGRVNEGDYRLYKIIKCGHLKETSLTAVRATKDPVCLICNEIRNKELATLSGFNYIKRGGKGRLILSCTNCEHISQYQVSNLSYGKVAKCRKCKVSTRKEKASYVYAFHVVNKSGNIEFIKIGKSNNPYLRHLKFSSNPENEYKFLGARKFMDEISALDFEKAILVLLKPWKVNNDVALEFMTNGFTECFTFECLEHVVNLLAIKKEKQ